MNGKPLYCSYIVITPHVHMSPYLRTYKPILRSLHGLLKTTKINKCALKYQNFFKANFIIKVTG